MDIFISKLKLSNINTHPVLNYLICMCRPTMALYITHAFECNNAFCCYEIHISSDFWSSKIFGSPMEIPEYAIAMHLFSIHMHTSKNNQ